MNRSKKSNKSSTSYRNEFPQQYKAQPIQSRKIRFICSQAATGAQITRQSMLNMLMSVGVTAVTPYSFPLFSSIKLTRVNAWCGSDTSMNLNNTSFVSISLVWNGKNSPNTNFSDTGNPNRPAHLSSTPPVNSLASFWSLFDDVPSQNEVIMSFTCPISTIWDFSFDYVLLDGAPQNAYTPTVPPAGQGVYCPQFPSIDIAGNATGVAGPLLPVDLNTFTL
jgi:hypothetical protein